ncbi:amidohydrolase family protein [Plastoroseomonas hellenica]|uniref:amidohydrolase family protein n=1 Tax=Plastoroseomonas hellenica TaxID=2687306 RepID=UPI001BAD5216|nr:amidohydrolase family protein [Plastoroseomonas hellenica]MBR0646003.1 amidohydrolase family protein [Plastoroseomonas hellenica]
MEPIALDCHAHLAPILPDRIADLPGVAWFPEEPRLVLDGSASLASPSVFRPEALIAWMDAQRIARAWISVPPPLYRAGLDEAGARIWCGYVNPALAEVAGRFVDRLAPSFLLPVRHPALAAEIVAGFAPRGARFAMAAGHAASGLVLSDPTYEPLWTVLDAAGAFLLLHPTAGRDPRLDHFFLHNLLGGPGETALAAAHLAMSRVLERFPRIRFILSHGAGSAAMIAGRLAHGQAVRRPGADTGARPMTEAFRDFHADCITHSAPALALAAAVLGPERILFGSDWPFSMGLIEPHRQLADVDPELRARIFAATPEG